MPDKAQPCKTILVVELAVQMNVFSSTHVCSAPKLKSVRTAGKRFLIGAAYSANDQ